MAVHSAALPSENFISGTVFAVILKGSASLDQLKAGLYISQNAFFAVTGPAGSVSALVSGLASGLGASEQAVNSRKAIAGVATPNRRVSMIRITSFLTWNFS